ncbi:hypothetical protein BS78_10G052700 [Paspalum vaginatum]|nr:hypothetical protein BS78_10G052700 [Paspalum vaginatum]
MSGTLCKRPFRKHTFSSVMLFPLPAVSSQLLLLSSSSAPASSSSPPISTPTPNTSKQAVSFFVSDTPSATLPLLAPTSAPPHDTYLAINIAAMEHPLVMHTRCSTLGCSLDTTVPKVPAMPSGHVVAMHTKHLSNNAMAMVNKSSSEVIFTNSSTSPSIDAALLCFSCGACNTQMVFEVTPFSLCTSSVGDHVWTEHLQHYVHDVAIVLRNFSSVGNFGSRGHKPSKPPWSIVCVFLVDNGKSVAQLLSKTSLSLVSDTSYNAEVQWKPPWVCIDFTSCYLADSFIMESLGSKTEH